MKALLLNIFYKMLKFKNTILVLYNSLISKIVAPPIVHTTDETLDEIVKGQYSVSRFGDGEFALMNGQSLLFQTYSPELRKRLRDIIKSRQEGHIVCIPNVFNNLDWCIEKSKKYWLKYLNLNRSKIYKMLDMKKVYYDTQVTRLYIDHKDKSKTEERFIKIRRLWNNKEIIIVEGEQSRLGIGNNLFDNAYSIERVLCPAVNAFAKYNEILYEIKKFDKSKLILIALGPTATVLSFDLSLSGYQAFDIGHIDIEYEWFLQKAQEKAPVKNKYIGEIQGGTNVSDIVDVKYESQIVSKII
jgi:glycosyltransferase family protein